MKIVVLVKNVADPDATWCYADDLTLDRSALEGRLSELDEYAVEQAVSLVERGLPATVTFLTWSGSVSISSCAGCRPPTRRCRWCRRCSPTAWVYRR